MSDSNHLSASLEDYLETIFHIIAEKQVARAKEISQRLNVSRSSVTEAFRALAKKELINYAPYEVITFTPKGRKLAKEIVRRHQALKDFFIKILMVDEEIAEAGACRVEHAAPQEIIDRLITFVNFIEDSPELGEDYMVKFRDYYSTRQNKKKY
ncbi:metal-dependent transcriptional regulator [Thermodesulfobacteriota bacterium]